MLFLRKLLLPVLLGAFILGGASVAGAAPAVPEITAQGLVKEITNAKGKVVVVNIFASWCPPCREELPGLFALRKQFAEKDVAFIAVSVDEATDQNAAGPGKVSKALMAFMDELPFNIPVFIGADGFARDIGVTAIPQLYVYDTNGKMAVKHKGFASQEEVEGIIKKLLAGRK